MTDQRHEERAERTTREEQAPLPSSAPSDEDAAWPAEEEEIGGCLPGVILALLGVGLLVGLVAWIFSS